MMIFWHSLFALLAVPLGAYLLLTQKGTVKHKRLGRIYLGFLLVVALTAIFIQELRPGNFSWIHLLIPLTLLSAIAAVGCAQQYQKTAQLRYLHWHRNLMISLYFGALILAGAFTLMPGRIFHQLLFG